MTPRGRRANHGARLSTKPEAGNTCEREKLHTYAHTHRQSIECIYHIEKSWERVQSEALVGSADAQLYTIQSFGGRFFLAVVIGLVLADTNYSSKGNVPKRSVVQVDHPALPLQFDKDSSKGQKACTSSNHAVKVHRKHCLLLFFSCG